ncbi:MAG: HAMP domain-containing sensor histidine kinase [Bacteroidales bacterium]|jgi:two-component sensor histidine kinase|nr:HAMP domain-containing histidine kinase [Bacteroidales bacterium]MDD4214188.1 HAMP domain-containing sensor histidine kinase [Bacteroidales bacterium]
MNIYIKKRRWKFLLFIAAMIIFFISLWYIDRFANQIEMDQRTKIKLWVDAITKKATLVNATDTFFSLIQDEERKKVELWANANIRLIKAEYYEDLTFYLDIIKGNNTIPVILTDDQYNITLAKNVDFNIDSIKRLEGKYLEDFSVYQPIEINYIGNKKILLHYKDSKLFTGLKEVLDKQVKAFLSEIVTNAPSVPVIVTDPKHNHIIAHGNIDTTKINNPVFVKQTIESMKSDNNMIKVDLPGQTDCVVYYKDSPLLIQLKYFPYVQFIIIGVFLFIAYLLFSTSRRAEQNKVWLGLAKETAHQLGTPLSSLIAWVELLRLKGIDEETLMEVTKDIQRLETITERFSKIGSAPKLETLNIIEVINNSVDYLKKRTSKKINYIIGFSSEIILVPLNAYLFEWVIENLCKNAIDAMSGNGTIEIDISEDDKYVFVDITDTGKGLSKSKFKTIFNPGYTSKKSGWGLGLSLSERIVENYHSGYIFVKSSVPNKGTSFRIQLKK